MKKPHVSAMTKRQLIKKSSAAIVLAMAATAFIVAFSLVTVNFLWGLSQHNNRIISEKSEASRVLKENVENIEQLQLNFNVFEAGDTKSETILDALPSKYDFPALATTMESLVQRSGLVLESFSGDDEEESAIQSQTQPRPVEIEFTLQVSGSYEDVKKLISNMENTIRPMKIVSMEMKGVDSNMNVSIKTITYYQPATSLEVETRTVE